MRKLLIVFLAGNLLSAPAYGAPSLPRKVLSTVAAPVAMYSTCAGLGFAFNKLAQYMPIVGNGATLPGARPYVAGLAAVIAWYNLATPMHQYYYTMFSGDTDRLDNAIQAIQINEKQIKEVLKDILYVKGELAKKSLSMGTLFAPHQSLSADPVWAKLANILRESPSSSDSKLAALKELAPARTGFPEQWSGFAVVKWWNSLKETVHENIMQPMSLAGEQYSAASWNFKIDKKLLVTWGGSRIAGAAGNILGVYATSQAHVTVEDARKFEDSARSIIEYAITVLEQLKEYKNSIKRVRDVAGLTESAVTVTGDCLSSVASTAVEVPGCALNLAQAAAAFPAGE
jgi:hypothetical protein